MFRVTKRMEIAGSHHLDLGYKSPCTNVHGHNWIIMVTVEGPLNRDGMVVDFKRIKDLVHLLDHKDLNKMIPINPTAERIAEWVAEEVQAYIAANTPDTTTRAKVTQVSVQESEGNEACYIP